MFTVIIQKRQPPYPLPHCRNRGLAHVDDVADAPLFPAVGPDGRGHRLHVRVRARVEVHQHVAALGSVVVKRRGYMLSGLSGFSLGDAKN